MNKHPVRARLPEALRRLQRDAFLKELPPDLVGFLEAHLSMSVRTWYRRPEAREIEDLARAAGLYAPSTVPIDLMTGLRNHLQRSKRGLGKPTPGPLRMLLTSTAGQVLTLEGVTRLSHTSCGSLVVSFRDIEAVTAAQHATGLRANPHAAIVLPPALAHAWLLVPVT